MHKLLLDGREQLYYQLYSILFQDITSGKYRVGDKVPAESELIRTYRVSRATARRAMEMLANGGLVIKKQGTGTMVLSNQPKNSLTNVIKYTKKQDLDHAVTAKKVIEQRVMEAPGEIAARLGLEAGTEVVMLKRVRFADEEPFYCEINYFEKEHFPEILERDFGEESLRVFLASTYQVRWFYASQDVYAVSADRETAELLQIPPGSPLIAIKRVSFDEKSVPREYVVTYYRGDKYHLEMELSI